MENGHRITVFPNIWNTTDPRWLDVQHIFERIRSGKQNFELLKEIRSENDKEKRNELKKRLNSICFSGQFSERDAKSLLQHSGLICLDIDGVLINEIPRIKKRICEDEHTYACFISPSGAGFKIIVKIPPSPEDHKGLFRGLEEYFNGFLGKYKIDPSGKDVSRVCYESYDPEIFVNESCEIWYTIHEDKIEPVPKTDQDEIIDKLQVWIDKKDNYYQGNRNNYLSTFAYALCRFGVDKEKTLGYFLQRFTDYPQKEATSLVNSVYRTEKFGSVEFDKELLNLPNEIAKHKIEIKNEKGVSQFWTIDTKGNVKIDTKQFFKFIEAQGFGIYYLGEGEKYQFVRKQNMIVHKVNLKDIKDIVLDFIANSTVSGLVYDVLSKERRYFEISFLNAIQYVHVTQARDKEFSSYLFFEDFYYEITALDATKKDYLDYDGGHIWAEQVCKKTLVSVRSDIENSDFYKFVFRSMGENIKRYRSFCSSIGYLCHTYKKYREAQMVYCCDESMDEIRGLASGGTGKNLALMCLKYVRSVTPIDGKAFDRHDRFAYQTVNDDTQIVQVNDYDGDIKEFFNKVTGEFEYEKKNRGKKVIDFDFSPKIVVNSNQSPKGFSDSFARRLQVNEFCQHYSYSHTPQDEFGDKDFFRNWNQNDWDYFYSWILSCIQLYFKEGLIRYSSGTIEEKQLVRSAGMDFFNYMQESERDWGTWNNARSCYEEFILVASEDYEIRVKDFISRIRMLCDIYRYAYKTTNKGIDMKIMIEGWQGL